MAVDLRLFENGSSEMTFFWKALCNRFKDLFTKIFQKEMAISKGLS